MANKRMFSLDIVDNDTFLEMPLSSQALYFHLGMRADDDGFVGNPKTIVRMCSCNRDDLNILIAKNFVKVFASGVLVILDWKINNNIRGDRYKPTIYTEEKKLLIFNDNGRYDLKNGLPKTMPTTCLPNDNQMTPQYSIGKDSIGKDSIGKDSIVYNTSPSLVEEVFDYWNSKNIIVHQKVTMLIAKAINKALENYKVEEIKTAIDRYKVVLSDENYQWKYSWKLVDFLSQKNALPDFLDDGAKWINYVNSISGTKNINKQIINTVEMDERWFK